MPVRDYQVMGVFTDVCDATEIHRPGCDRMVYCLTWTHCITVVALGPVHIARGIGEYMHLLAQIEKTTEEPEFISGDDHDMPYALIERWTVAQRKKDKNKA